MVCRRRIRYPRRGIGDEALHGCQGDGLFVMSSILIRIRVVFLSFFLLFLNSSRQFFRVFMPAILFCMDSLFTKRTLSVPSFTLSSVLFLILLPFLIVFALITFRLGLGFRSVPRLVLRRLVPISVRQDLILIVERKSVLL